MLDLNLNFFMTIQFESWLHRFFNLSPNSWLKTNLILIFMLIFHKPGFHYVWKLQGLTSSFCKLSVQFVSQDYIFSSSCVRRPNEIDMGNPGRPILTFLNTLMDNNYHSHILVTWSNCWLVLLQLDHFVIWSFLTYLLNLVAL